MATTFLDPGTSATFGIELWAAGGGTYVTSNSTTVHGQARSIKLDTGAIATSPYLVSPNSVVSNAGGRGSIYVYFPSVAPTAASDIFDFDNAAITENHVVVQLRSDGKLQAFFKGGTTVVGTHVLTAASWQQISVAFTWTSTTVNELRVWIGATLDITKTNDTTSALAITNMELVLLGSSTGADFVGFFSDIYADDSSSLTYPGDIRVTAKRPNANGTTNGWLVQIGAGGSGYGTGHSPQINERALSTTNGWSTALLSTTEEFSIENRATGDADLTGATIVDFMGWVYASASGAVTAQMILAGANSNVALTTTNTMFTKAAGSTTYPAGSTDIGMISSGSAGTDSLYECGIIIAYILPSLSRTLSETLFHVDTISRQLTSPRKMTDTLPVVDRWNDQKVSPRTLLENLQLTETMSAQLSRVFRWLLDSAVFPDVFASPTVLQRLVQDAAVVNDAVSRMLAMQRAISEATSLADASAAQMLRPRLVQETAAMNDVMARLLNSRRSMGETLSLSDAVAGNVRALRAILDALSASDLLTRTGVFSRQSAEMLELTDQIAATVKTAYILAQLLEAMELADSVKLLVLFRRDLADSLELSDQVSRMARLARLQPEMLVLSDAQASVKAFLRSLLETSMFVDQSSSAVLALRQILERPLMTDTFNVMATVARQLLDAMLAADVVEIKAAGRVLVLVAEALAFSDSSRQTVQAIRASLDTLSMADQSSTVVLAVRRMLDSVLLTEIESQLTERRRQAFDVVGLTDVTRSLAQLSRTLPDTVLTSDTIIRTSAMVRKVVDAVLLQVLETGRSTTPAAVSTFLLEALLLIDELDRLATSRRDKADSAGMSDTWTVQITTPGGRLFDVAMVSVLTFLSPTVSIRMRFLGERTGVRDWLGVVTGVRVVVTAK